MAIAIPIILAILILNVNPKVIDKTLKFNDNGEESPNSCPYPSHQSQLTEPSKFS